MRSSLAGAVCWTLAAPLFLTANVVVGLAWHDPGFDWTTTNVSDLGNVTCGIWDTTRPRYVCSPWHDAMNAAFVLTAVLLIAGLLLTWRARGRVLMMLGAAGLALAGLFPADRDENLHLLGAAAVFALGNAGLVAAAWARGGPPRPVTLGFGLLGVAGAVLFATGQDLGLGPGTTERAAVFALPVWACYAGVLHLARKGEDRPGPQ